jgi:hypothetical protein
VPLAALRLHQRERFTYVYNFIDHWACDLRLEAIVPLDPRRIYPVCTGGTRAAPPEDCGGAWAYLQRVDRHPIPREARATVAERLEQARGEEQWSFIDSCPAEWSRLPMLNGPLTVGIDGGYVRAQPKSGWFEGIAGKSLLAFTQGEESEAPVSSKCFAFVPTSDQKPKRRLFEVRQSQGHQLNQQITFLSDGGDTVRELRRYLNPQAEHLLDWFHDAMRLTVLQQTAKGLPD